MTLKSVVDVDVNDGDFKEFQASFEKYQAMLSKMPGAWASVDKHMKSSFETVAASLLAQSELTRKAAAAEDDLDKRAHKTGSVWTKMAKDAKSFARDVKDAGLAMARWVGVGSIFSGLIGAGGLFGLDLLAARASAGRRSSLGLGVSYGEQRAFSTNFGRVVDPQSYLSGVNAALHDVTKRSLLYGAGLSEGDISGKNAAQVSATLLGKLKSLADRTPSSLLGQTLQARGLDQLIGLEDFERLKNTPRSELDDYRRSYEKDRGSMNLDQGTLRAWQDLDVQLSRAGNRIESAFIRGLDPLIRSGAFTKLSDAITDSISTLLGSKDLKVWLDELGDGIRSFAVYIGSPKFQGDLKEFTTDVGAVAKATANALRWLGVIPDKGAPKQKPMTGWQAIGTLLNPFDVSASDNAAAIAKIRNAFTFKSGDTASGPGFLDAMGLRAPTSNLSENTVQSWLRSSFPGLAITGGARTAAQNARLEGSAKNSMHLTGQAVDLKLPAGTSFDEFKRELQREGFPYTELLNEGRHGRQGPHVHLGWRPKTTYKNDRVAIDIRNNTGGSAVVSAGQANR